MARTKPLERARDRVLTDDELRKVWRAAGDMKNAFGPFVRFTLLTATRREEAASMRRSELDGDLWVIPAARYKTKHNHAVPLSRAAQTVLQAMPVINGSDLVFTHNGARAMGGLSRAGVPSDHAERCLGHVINGVRGVYDHYEYRPEKTAAFEKLAEQVAAITA